MKKTEQRKILEDLKSEVGRQSTKTEKHEKLQDQEETQEETVS